MLGYCLDKCSNVREVIAIVCFACVMKVYDPGALRPRSSMSIGRSLLAPSTLITRAGSEVDRRGRRFRAKRMRA